jgi:hypothetical protein
MLGGLVVLMAMALVLFRAIRSGAGRQSRAKSSP